MLYLNFNEYLNLGGNLDEAAFNRFINRACGIVAHNTHSRVDKMAQIPCEVKHLCRDLVDYLNDEATNRTYSSRSQSAGEVSESISFAARSSVDKQAELDNLICDYLLAVKDDKGTPLLYRGF